MTLNKQLSVFVGLIITNYYPNDDHMKTFCSWVNRSVGIAILDGDRINGLGYMAFDTGNESVSFRKLLGSGTLLGFPAYSGRHYCETWLCEQRFDDPPSAMALVVIAVIIWVPPFSVTRNFRKINA